jgi:hypothetical protein
VEKLKGLEPPISGCPESRPAAGNLVLSDKTPEHGNRNAARASRVSASPDTWASCCTAIIAWRR